MSGGNYQHFDPERTFRERPMLVNVPTITYNRQMTTQASSSQKWSIPDGWRELYEQLIEGLASVESDLEVIQAKQKFGGLRVYLNRFSPEADRLIETAARKSRSTCEECGAEAKTRANRQGYYRTLCDQHADG